jgi:TRAP-type C4-dicarboxylate transport system permease small subunit
LLFRSKAGGNSSEGGIKMTSLADTAFIKIIGRVQETVLLVLLILIPVLVTIQVVLRYLLQLPLMGIEELLLFPTIWLYMLGGSNASRERSHIECGVLVLYIRKEKSIALFKLVKTAIAAIVSCWLTYWAWWFFMYSLNTWKLSDLLYLPMFFGESAILVGLVLMTMFTLIELTDIVRYTSSLYRRKA